MVRLRLKLKLMLRLRLILKTRRSACSGVDLGYVKTRVSIIYYLGSTNVPNYDRSCTSMNVQDRR